MSKNTAEKTSHNLSVDLELFNQLLEMVDGDWSDSIRGVCKHITKKLDTEIIIFSVYDKNFEEFIYLEYDVNDETKKKFIGNDIHLSRGKSLEILRRIYSKDKTILECNIYSEKEVQNIINTYFDDEEMGDKIINNFHLKTLFSVPIIDNENYKSLFHILSRKTIEEKDKSNEEKNILQKFVPQLNIALEIIFLVRDLYIKATHDGLTKLFNRKQGQILLKNEIGRIQRNDLPLSLVMLDLDYFKNVNDRYGHSAGDEVLKYISGLLLESMREGDIASRYGGEEFLIVLPDTKLSDAVNVIKRLKETIASKNFNFSGNDTSITSSFGIVQYNKTKFKNEIEFIDEADKFLYMAKNNGRNRIEFQELF